VEPAVTVESVYAVTFPTVTRAAPSRTTSYPLTATLSVDAFHVSCTDVEVGVFADRFFGVVGAVVSAAAAGPANATERPATTTTVAPTALEHRRQNLRFLVAVDHVVVAEDDTNRPSARKSR